MKGPQSYYYLPDGSFETIPGNSGIRRFIFEHLQDFHRIIWRILCAGGVFAVHKLVICTPEITLVGHTC
ncbi:hypothetical protein SISSUDRAFT_995307, partial [Sistotremastrum suecicum HHB10207 ss-3]